MNHGLLLPGQSGPRRDRLVDEVWAGEASARQAAGARGLEHALLDVDHLRCRVPPVLLHVPAEQRGHAVGRILVEGAEPNDVAAVGESGVDNAIQLGQREAERCVGRDGADQVAPGEGRRLRGQAPLADELADIGDIEAAFRCPLPPEQRGDPFPVEPNRRRSLPPLGDDVAARGNLVLALARGEHRELVPVPAVHPEGRVHGRHLARPPAELLAHRPGDADHLEGAVARHRDLHAELAHQRIPKHGLTHRAGGRRMAVQGDTVQLSPGAVVAQDVVGDRDVGVELWVDGDAAGGRIGDRSRGAVQEVGKDELRAHRDGLLGRAVVAASPARMRLEVLTHRVDRRLVGAQHRGAGRLVAHRPQQRDALGGTEGDVVSNHRLPRPAPLHEVSSGRWIAAAQQ